jgi:hypothetical protein
MRHMIAKGKVVSFLRGHLAQLTQLISQLSLRPKKKVALAVLAMIDWVCILPGTSTVTVSLNCNGIS